MSSEWRQVNLKEVTSILGDGLHGTPEYDENGDYFFINGNNLGSGRIVFNDTTKRVSFDEFNKHKKNLTNRTILVSINGTIGNVAFYNNEKVVLGKSACYFNVLDSVDKHFVRYVLESKIFQDYIENLATGSTIKNVSLKLMRDFQFRLPPIALQQRISEILSYLDDRIALLRETNATLEAIAQALFKSWFVDFDPVRAKMEGRLPEGMDETTAALFPDGLEESELGTVPIGWAVGVLGDILKLRNERVQPSENTALLPYVPIENINAKFPFLQEFKSGQDANSSLTLFYKGDVLFGAMRPYFHKVCSAPFDGVTRTTVFTLTPMNPNVGVFALFQAYQDSTIQYATQHSEGSTIPYAKWRNSMELMPLFIPAEPIQMAFSSVVSSFVECANSNILQAQNLAALRDTLLPRLISGQLRLTEVEARIDAISA